MGYALLRIAVSLLKSHSLEEMLGMASLASTEVPMKYKTPAVKEPAAGHTLPAVEKRLKSEDASELL